MRTIATLWARNMVHLIFLATALTTLAVFHYGSTGWPTAWQNLTAASAPVGYVVDGDTLRLAGGAYVRLIGIDTPEVGECGYTAAKVALDRMVGERVTLRNPAAVEDADYYQRRLRYVTATSGKDAGLVLIRRGLADARYDSRDGYGWHPMEARYVRADAANANVCP